MDEGTPLPPERVTELQVSAHLMQLDAGVYCVHHAPGSPLPDPHTGLPGARLSLPPGETGRGVVISGFRDDGWLGSLDAAALIRVSQGPAQVLMTIYQAAGANQPPRLQVLKLVEGASVVPSPAATAPPAAAVPAPSEPPPAVSDARAAEVSAHVQLRGDIAARLGSWVGEPGSQQWIEGFVISPREGGVAAEDLEYQAVLGRGWLSPWAAGTQYCGSRGMALPILGLRVRLRGRAVATHTVQVRATFTDGTAVGPVGAGDACEAESLAPLEAFRIELAAIARRPARSAAATRTKKAPPPPAAKPRRASPPAPPAKPKGPKR